MSSIVYGGLDVHQKMIVCYLVSEETGEVIRDQVLNDRARLMKAVARWSKLGELRLCYEASGAGFVIKRWLDEAKVHCDVIAPSSIPKAPGDRVKTDRRDSEKLAKLYRGGLLQKVRVPSHDEEDERAIVRLRDELTRDMTRAKNRVLKYLATLGFHYDGQNWSQRHKEWIAKLSLNSTQRLNVQLHMDLLEELLKRRLEIDRKIEEIAQSERYRERVQRLMCLKGIGLYGAMVLLTETGDAHRFRGAPNLMSYFGLVPREDSSGDSRRRGKLTKAGSARARWILGQAAWSQRHRPGCSNRLKKHWQTQPDGLVSLAKRAEKRLNHKFWRIASRKDSKTAATAVAREMAGFVWSILTFEPTKLDRACG